MNIKYLRASTVNTYKDCPWKFFLTYVVGFPSGANKKAELGTIVHHVLELLAKAKKNGYTEYYTSRRVDPEYLLEICWNRYTPKNPDFAYDHKDYKFCREQIETVINSNYDPLKMDILRTEHQFEIEANAVGFQYHHHDYDTGKIEQGNALLRGTIDLITRFDDETIEIVDYKTGLRSDWVTGKEKEFDDFLKDVQLRIYDLCTNILYKDYKYRLLTIIFTRTGGPFTVTFSPEDLNDTLDILRRYFHDIKNDIEIDRLLDDKSRKDQMWKCDYVCQFGKIRHMYVNEQGDILYDDFKRIQKRYQNSKFYPDTIEQDGIVYKRVTGSQEGRRVCDIYRDIFKEKGLQESYKILKNISIDESARLPVSRRNNYESSKITKEKLNDSN